ncbi:MAG: hypothetical protein HZB29_01185 [Nitrospinae bacterium]|nr:hypothetical protein [Nitrospinota bacterium]
MGSERIGRPSALKRALFSLGALAAGIFILETASWAFFYFYASGRLVYHLRVDDEEYARSINNAPSGSLSGSGFDPVLGWENTSKFTSDPVHGGRNTPCDSKTVRISSYGDSFTFCQDVNDDQTWQYYLSGFTKTKVLNYGVKGYGPDQALLKMERDLNSGRRTDIIILAVLSENIARAVNISPLYYWVTAGGANIKPALVKENGAFVWRTSHLNDPESPEGRRRIVEAVQKYDYWHEFNRLRPVIKFPYSLSLVKTADYLLFRVKRWPDLWKEERPLAVMNEIVRRFHALSRERGFMPILLFIPEAHDLKLKDRGEKASYATFKEGLVNNGEMSGLVVADALDENFETDKFNIAPYSGHASAYGNRIIAQAVHKKLAGITVFP